MLWLTWGGGTNGVHGVALGAGSSTSATVLVAGQPLVVTCTIGSVSVLSGSGILTSYRPGDWAGDGLDDLYNIGGTGAANQLIAGISHSVDGSEYSFPISCTTTLNGAPYDLPGLVVADAEQSGATEYVQGSADGEWQITEKLATAGCTNAYPATLTGGATQTLRLAGGTACSVGPMAVGFLSFKPTAYVGAARTVTMNFQFRGSGKSAIAIGLLGPNADTSDAPASYGVASHLFAAGLTPDGLDVGMTADVNAAGFVLSTLTNPVTDRLGALEDADGLGLTGNASATTDDTTGIDDEDAVDVAALAALLVTNSGAAYSVPLSCAGTGSVRGWIDFNRNGVFTDSGEASALTTCAGGSATLSFTIPAGSKTGTSYLRVRYAKDAAELSAPTGASRSGEVEDHVIPIGTQFRMAKAWGASSGAGHVANIGSTTGLGTNTVAFASTAPTNANGAFVTIYSGQTFTLPGETMSVGTLANYRTNLSCDNGVVPSGTNGQTGNTMTIPAGLSAALTCTYTNNGKQGNLSIAKGNGETSLVSGATTVYSIVVSNSGPDDVTGAVVRDPAATGLNCSSVGCVGAACPASPSVSNLQGAGETLSQLISGSSVTFTLTCSVTATGV